MFDVHAVYVEAWDNLTNDNDLGYRPRNFGSRLWVSADRAACAYLRESNGDRTLMDFLGSLANTEYDPYYNDSNIERFLLAIKTGEYDE